MSKLPVEKRAVNKYEGFSEEQIKQHKLYEKQVRKEQAERREQERYNMKFVNFTTDGESKAKIIFFENKEDGKIYVIDTPAYLETSFRQGMPGHYETEYHIEGYGDINNWTHTDDILNWAKREQEITKKNIISTFDKNVGMLKLKRAIREYAESNGHITISEALGE